VRDAIWPLLVGTMLLQVAAGRISDGGPGSTLLRVWDQQTSLKPTAGPNNVINCIVVYPDGRLHLELRRQEFFFGNASDVSYEGKLSIQDLAFLRTILDGADVRNLSAFPSPAQPMAAHYFESFHAEIHRSTAVQDVGYLAWEGEGPKNSDDDKRVWHTQHLALQPLIDWSRWVKSQNQAEWRSVPNANSACD
jgi:hypothetical protein